MTNKSLKIKRSGSDVVLETSESDLKGKIASKQISLNDSYYDEGGKNGSESMSIQKLKSGIFRLN
jgi:hypothetical protein